MRRSLLVVAVVVVAAVGAAVAYQAAARQRDYLGLLARGDAANRDDQTFGAIEAYSGALALRPDSTLAHLRRGEAYQRRGELDEAARDFRAAASLDPSATRPLEALGDVLFQLQRYDRASDVYARSLRLDDRSPLVNYKLAMAQYRAGDLEAALTSATAAVRLNERFSDAAYLRGICLRDSRRDPEAIEAFEKTVALAPNFPAAREELADLYAAAGLHDKQVEQLQLLASMDGDHVQRQVTLGLAQASAGHEELAVMTLGKALDTASDQPLVYRALGQVWLNRAQAHNDRVFLSKAIEALARVASSPSATSDALTLYGRALLLDGQTELAEHALEQASTRFPLDPSSLTLYATAAERQTHLDAARQALIDYTALVGDDAQFSQRASHIAALSLRLNDPKTAVVWLQKASDASPGDVRLLAGLADAEWRNGDREGAQAAAARAVAIDPSNELAVAVTRRMRPKEAAAEVPHP